MSSVGAWSKWERFYLYFFNLICNLMLWSPKYCCLTSFGAHHQNQVTILSSAEMEKVVHAFISFFLDFCYTPHSSVSRHLDSWPQYFPNPGFGSNCFFQYEHFILLILWPRMPDLLVTFAIFAIKNWMNFCDKASAAKHDFKVSRNPLKLALDHLSPLSLTGDSLCCRPATTSVCQEAGMDKERKKDEKL